MLDLNSYGTTRTRFKAGAGASNDILGRQIRYLAKVDHRLLRTLLVVAAGWLQRQQAHALPYVLEENRVGS